jgi:hypothetical protein
MGMYCLRLIITSLLIVFFTLPIHAQNLWNIYRENEQVKLILETSRVWDARSLSGYSSALSKQLKLNYAYTLEPMFPGAPSVEEAAKIYGFQPRYDLRSFYILGISTNEGMLRKYESPFDLADRLRNDSSKWGELSMKAVEPDLPLFAYPTVSVQSSSNCPEKMDSPVDRAWSLRNMRVPQAWQFSEENGYLSEGQGEKIGHPDTGYSQHVDLDEKALEKRKGNNFIEKYRLPEDPLEPDQSGTKQPGHGTATGSVIISRGDVTNSPPENTEGGTKKPGKVTGVACKAELVPYRSIESVARFTYGNIEKAIYKAVNDGCSVVSLSLGGIGHSALNAALEHAIGKNVIVVAAAGNFLWWPVVYPARYPFCIAVAASNFDDKPWKNSAHGTEVTISAPGEAVWRALRSKPNESTEKVEPSCGTSYSTANVAGVSALWLAHHKRHDLIKKLSGDTKLQFIFKRLLQHTARCPEGWKKQEYGTGIVDAETLLRTNPDEVKKQAIADYEEFTKKKRESAESNLQKNKKIYNQTWRAQ